MNDLRGKNPLNDSALWLVFELNNPFGQFHECFKNPDRKTHFGQKKAFYLYNQNVNFTRPNTKCPWLVSNIW